MDLLRSRVIAVRRMFLTHFNVLNGRLRNFLLDHYWHWWSFNFNFGLDNINFDLSFLHLCLVVINHSLLTLFLHLNLLFDFSNLTIKILFLFIIISLNLGRLSILFFSYHLDVFFNGSRLDNLNYGLFFFHLIHFIDGVAVLVVDIQVEAPRVIAFKRIFNTGRSIFLWNSILSILRMVWRKLLVLISWWRFAEELQMVLLVSFSDNLFIEVRVLWSGNFSHLYLNIRLV